MVRTASSLRLPATAHARPWASQEQTPARYESGDLVVDFAPRQVTLAGEPEKLRDDPANPRFIHTEPGVGYRLVGTAEASPTARPS